MTEIKVEAPYRVCSSKFDLEWAEKGFGLPECLGNVGVLLTYSPAIY